MKKKYAFLPFQAVFFYLFLYTYKNVLEIVL